MYARETDVVEAINDPAVRENTTFLKVFNPSLFKVLANFWPEWHL